MRQLGVLATAVCTLAACGGGGDMAPATTGASVGTAPATASPTANPAPAPASAPTAAPAQTAPQPMGGGY